MGSHTDSTALPEPATPAGRAGLDAILADPGRAVIALAWVAITESATAGHGMRRPASR